MPPRDMSWMTWTADVERNLLFEVLKRMEIAIPAAILHDIMPTMGETWTAELERNFLIYVFLRMKIRVPAATFHDIATEWGQHTVNSLQKQFSRMKQAYQKNATGGGAGETSTSKCKVSEEEEGPGTGDEIVDKAKKVKTDEGQKDDTPVRGAGADNEV